jgi:hypothetical protein
MTTATVYLSQYTDEIQSIASYAKRVKYNPETGDLSELMRGWYKEQLSSYQFLTDKDNWSQIYNRFQRMGLK